MTSSGSEYCYARYKIPILPAYSILNYTIQGMKTNMDGVQSATRSAISGDEVIVYGVNNLTMMMVPQDPILVVNYLGIRDYNKFFPHFGNELLRERAAQFLEEADKAFMEASWLSFAMMAGAVFESLLFDVVGDKKAGLGKLVGKTKAADIFDEDALEALKVANDARNLVHAGRFEDRYITRDVAMSVRLVLEQFLRKDWNTIKQSFASQRGSEDVDTCCEEPPSDSELDLTPEQKAVLERYIAKIGEALSDLFDSLDTGYMSDSKESVYALARDDEWGILPELVQGTMREMSAAATSSVSGGGGNQYVRAGAAINDIQNLEKYVRGLLSSETMN